MPRYFTFFPNHWTTLIDALRSAAVRRIQVFNTDFSALDNDALQIVAACHGLQSLEVKRSVVPSGFVRDDGYLPPDASKGPRSLCLELCGSRVTDMFVVKFFEVTIVLSFHFPPISSARLGIEIALIVAKRICVINL